MKAAFLDFTEGLHFNVTLSEKERWPDIFHTYCMKTLFYLHFVAKALDFKAKTIYNLFIRLARTIVVGDERSGPATAPPF